jgi:polar amino acid transport system substrate-binding protein
MKKATLAAGALTLAVIASACGSTKTTTTTNASAATGAAMKMGDCDVTGAAGSIKLKPVVADTLTLQTSLPAPGWFVGTEPAAIKGGYEYCMAAEIAHRAGLSKLVVVNQDFPQIVAGTTKDFDMALAEISITDKRKQVVDFSVPYFASDIGILVKKDTKVANTADLKKLKVGVQADTTGADFATKNISPDVKVYPDAATLMSAVDSGAIDAAMTDTSIVQEQEKKSNGAEKVVGQYKTGESYGALYPKGSANKTEIDKAIQAMIDEKAFSKLATKWLSGDPAAVPFFTV